MGDRLHEGLWLENIFEATMEGILVTDEQGTILKASTACKNIFGYEACELIRKNINYLIPDEFGKIYKKLAERYSKHPKTGVTGKEMGLRALIIGNTNFINT